MKEKLKTIKENKVLKIIGNILYAILFIIVILMLIVVILQRTTNNNVALGGYRMFTVVTGSMVPQYEVGDVLISKEIDPDKIQVGDDIVYKGKEGSFKDRIVTHRVIFIEKQDDGNYKIITKGIAKEIADDEQDPEIDQTQVYGKIVYKVKSLSYIGKLISNIYIFYFLIFVPIAIIIFKQIKNIVSNDEDEEDENDDKKD